MKRAAALLLTALALVSLAWVAIPAVLIRPFGAQTPRGLAVSYALRSTSPWGTLVLLVLGLAAVVALWPRIGSWIGRALVVLAVTALGGSAYLARQNHFEWMFHPLPRPEFAEASEAKHVAEDDLVLGVQVGSEARAYPVLALAYHHVVNDSVAGEPVVATY
jgi:hypothetical protein